MKKGTLWPPTCARGFVSHGLTLSPPMPAVPSLARHSVTLVELSVHRIWQPTPQSRLPPPSHTSQCMENCDEPSRAFSQVLRGASCGWDLRKPGSRTPASSEYEGRETVRPRLLG